MELPYHRIYNFSAGPACLPVDVLESARDDMLNYKGAGMSVMEMSHRGEVYEGIHHNAEKSLRELLTIPQDYKLLFLQGGASTQFSLVPKNLLKPDGKAQYLTTGSWGQKAIAAAKFEGNAEEAYTAKETNFDRAPKLADLDLDPSADYVHMTLNETIQGVDYLGDPDCAAPLVCDMSSNIGSRRIDMSKYDLVYAGAQKNLGPAGVTVVFYKESVLAPEKELPPMFDFRLQAENDSLYNTPPCWAIYVVGLVAKHWLNHGGIEAVEAQNEAKAKQIYDAIDESGGFYRGHAQTENRSRMNIAFVLGDDSLTERFISEAKDHGFDGLKGHRSVGGCRASVYNSFPERGCQDLAKFMRQFANQNG